MASVSVPPPVRRSIDALRHRGETAWRSLENQVRGRVAKRAGSNAPAPKPSLRPVVLIHGLNVPRQVMTPLALRLSRQYGRPCHNLTYPTFGGDIPATAAHLADQIRALGLTEFDAVTHSMGGIVLRWAVANHELPPLRRAVLIAPPNTGAWLADHLHARMGFFFPIVFGRAGLQLRTGHRGVLARAGTLRGSEVGIIAGGNGTPQGVRNWFGIPGDSDGTVAVEETILPGMKDFALVESNHTMLSFRAETARLVDHFLAHGVFRHRRHNHSE